MQTYSIAVIPGDGIGKEVTNEALKVLKTLADRHGFKIETREFEWSCDYYLKHGKMMPDDILDILKGFDSIYLGCIGDVNKVPDHISLTLLLKIRKGFNQYVNLRPIKLYPGVETPVKTARPETIDMVVFRENTGRFVRDVRDSGQSLIRSESLRCGSRLLFRMISARRSLPAHRKFLPLPLRVGIRGIL